MTMTPRARYILRMVAVNAAATVFVAVAFIGVGFDTPWRRAAEALGVAFLFSFCIGTLCAVCIPRISPFLWQYRFPVNWLLLVASLFGFAMVGSAITIGLLVGIGYIPSARFAAWLLESARFAIITTLLFGVSISAYEMARTRLDEAALALRTKERDEAEARRAAIEARLASLESRVQPHFLFNTLNSIASLIQTDPNGAERMTAQLASLVRSSLDAADGPLVRLDQELRTVRDYLEIERVRFGDRLQRELTIDENTAAALVPRFSLQTLVENAVKYAIAPRRGGGRVSLRAAARHGRVRIEVEDDGPGFEAGAVPPNHGLALLRQRLALTYGDRATLNVQSVPGRTVVFVEVPESA
jgi:sensor histidine kinase YesM